jgi:hypothetical protein
MSLASAIFTSTTGANTRRAPDIPGALVPNTVAIDWHGESRRLRSGDMRSELDIWAAGASIGAFHSVAVVCRFPDVFGRACAMSGTYGLRRFYETAEFTAEFWSSSPLHFVPTLSGRHLDVLKTRMIVLASGEGRAEDLGESWADGQRARRPGHPQPGRSVGAAVASRLADPARDAAQVSRRVGEGITNGFKSRWARPTPPDPRLHLPEGVRVGIGHPVHDAALNRARGHHER